VCDIFGPFDTARQPVRKPKHRIAMVFIYFKESRRFASLCPFQQKFICGSFWQKALDSVGIVPTGITFKRLKDTPVT
jgi:hypothetical protein